MTTAPTAPPAEHTPHSSGSGLPAITLPPGRTAAPDRFREAGLAHHNLAVGMAEARAKAAQPAPRPELARTAHTAKPRAEKKSVVDRFGPWVALYAAVGLTASGEYALAQLVGFPGAVAALLPTAIDVYVVQAMRRHRDVAVALILMVATNALYHLGAKHLFGMHQTISHGHVTYSPSWWLIVGVAAIAPFIVWRVHRITETKSGPETTARNTRETETKTTTETTVSAPVSREVSQGAHETSRETSETGTPREAETKETGETTVSRSRETAAETNPVSHPETTSPQIPQRETTNETNRETRSPHAQRPRRETKTETRDGVTAIGDRETETQRLLDLMKKRGGPLTVSLDDAITETSRPKSTAAKRLAAARDLYAKSA